MMNAPSCEKEIREKIKTKCRSVSTFGMSLCSFKYLEFSRHDSHYFILSLSFIWKIKHSVFLGYTYHLFFSDSALCFPYSACLMEYNTWYPPSAPPLCPALWSMAMGLVLLASFHRDKKHFRDLCSIAAARPRQERNKAGGHRVLQGQGRLEGLSPPDIRL